MILLGACSPWAVRLAVEDVEHSGEVAGRLYAISTAGSLVGTMVSALLLIPFIGTQRTFLVLRAAARDHRLGRPRLALSGGAGGPRGRDRDPGRDGQGDRPRGAVLWEGETQVQYARVIEESDGDRRLELNEGAASHSLFRPGSYLTGNYWDGLVVLPFAALDRAPRRVAILGNAAGTVGRAYGHFFPRFRSTGSRSTAS